MVFKWPSVTTSDCFVDIVAHCFLSCPCAAVIGQIVKQPSLFVVHPLENTRCKEERIRGKKAMTSTYIYVCVDQYVYI